MHISHEVWIGILTGIASGLLTIVFQNAIRNAFSFVIRFGSNQPSINGKWSTTFTENGQEFHETVVVRQRGRRVSGDIIFQGSDHQTVDYRFEGEFSNRILTATYFAKDKSNFERGVFALEYTSRQRLVGQHVLFSSESTHLISSEYVWTHAT